MAALCCFSNEVQDAQDATLTKRNRCTDFTFLLFFLLFWLGLIFISTYAFIVGSPLRLIHGSDSFGNVCGHQNEPFDNLPFSGLDMSRRPYLFHLNQNEPQKSVKICVRRCPREHLANMAEIYLFYTRTNSSLCRYDFDFTNAAAIRSNPVYQPYIEEKDRYSFDRYQQPFRDPNALSNINETGLCPVLPVVPTRPLLYHCVPELAITQGLALGHSLYDFISSYVPLKKIISDVCNAYEEMAIMGVVALVSSFISAFVIHFVASIASWVILLTISILLCLITALFWWTYIDIHYRLDTFKVHEKIPFFLPEDADNESIILTVAIICTVFTLVILYAASTLRSHVRFVVALFHETAACIRCMPLLLIQPLWTLIVLVSFLSAWLLTMMALSTANHASRESRYLQSQHTDAASALMKTTQLSQYTLISYNGGNSLSWIHYMWWYLVIALIWISEFILSCQQMVIAGAVSNWYFSRDRERLESPISGSICDLFRRHLGSVALGSFLITLFKLPRLIIQQITSRLRQHEERGSAVARGMLQACTCCLWIVERFLAYLSRNAYTVVVIERTDFCTSARLAFQALLSNAIRVAAINSIGDFILFLGKLSVAVLTAIVGIFLVRSNPSLHYWTVPVILMSLFAFWVAHCLLSVYEMVIDAMFLCFCQDMNRHDGSPGNEYYAPPSLMRFLSEDQQEPMAEIRGNGNGTVAKQQPEENDYSSVQ